MQKTPGSGIGMQSWQVSHRPDMSVLLELHSITFVHPGMHLYWPPKHAAEAHADFQKMMRDFVDLCYLIQTTATVSAVTRKESACGMRHCFPAKDTVILPNIADWEEVGWDLLRCKRQKRVKGRHKVVYHRSKDISIPFPLDQPARLEDILRICLQRPMQRAFMQVVCRRSMVSWQFLRFLVAIKEHCDTPKRVTTRLLGCKCASFTDISIRCMAYPCLRRGGTGNSMDAWHRFIYNVPLLHWAQ